MAAARQFEEMMRRTEEELRDVSCKRVLEMKLGIACAAVVLALWAALVRGQTMFDRITVWILAGVLFLLGGGFFCRDLYLRRKLKRVLAEMQTVRGRDLESGLPPN